MRRPTSDMGRRLVDGELHEPFATSPQKFAKILHGSLKMQQRIHLAKGPAEFTSRRRHSTQMELTDMTLTCLDCGESFVFSAGEQTFFREMQFRHAPKHCKRCRARRVNVRPRRETSVLCSQCGASTIVPFVPREGRPVLCRSCFRQQRPETSQTPEAA